jgi:aspartate racemase
MESKIVGVIGGMGPHASNRFMELIYTYKKLKKDHLYPRIILDSNTKIPSRTRAIIYNEKSPLNGMIESANKLYEFGVNAIALPCNTAHIWIQSLQKKTKIPIFDITDIVSKKINEKYKLKKVNIYIFGTALTTKKRIYIRKLSNFKNIKIITINNTNQKRIEKLIYLIKENNFQNNYKKKFQLILKNLKFKKEENLIILACTELSYFKSIKYKNIRIMDTNSILAQTVFDYSENKYDFFENNQIQDFWIKRSKSLKKKKLGLLQSTMLTKNEKYAKNKDEIEKNNVIKKIKKYIKNKSLLEAGSGTGRWTIKFLDYAKNIDAYEKNYDLIEYAKKKLIKYKQLKLINKSVTNIDNRKKYEVVISIALLHYLNDKEYSLFIKNIQNCTKRNSIIILRETLSFKYDFELFKYYSEALKMEYNAHYRSIENISEKLGKSFKLIEQQKIFNPEEKKPETFQSLAIFKKI